MRTLHAVMLAFCFSSVSLPCLFLFFHTVTAMDDICQQLAKIVGADVLQVRKTADIPPRVSVIDVLVAITRHSQHVAAQDLRRLVSKYPELASKIDFKFQFGGQGQRKTPVAGVTAIVEVLMLVTGPCAARLRQEVAELMVRYLGGDLRIIGEVYRQHGLQECLQVHAPSDPRCAFRQAAQATTSLGGATFDMQSYTKHLVDEVGKQLAETYRKQIQQTHPWDFQRGVVRDNPLVQEGVIVEGDDLLDLDRDERVVRMTDWLKERVTSQTWARHGHKLKNMFAITLKKRKREHCRNHEQPLYIARAHGEYRIVYTEVADQELMSTVFRDVRRRFSGIVTRDEEAMQGRRRQMRLEDFFKPVGSQPPGDQVDDGEGTDLHAEPGAPSSGGGGAVPQAPASLPLFVKRGDESVDACD